MDLNMFGFLKRKKDAPSDLRFCQNASELDAYRLFSDSDLELAISRVSEWHHDPKAALTEAYAYGIVRDIIGGRPLLPVEVIFSFTTPCTPGNPGRGEVWKMDPNSMIPYYQMKIVIYDPDKSIYEGFLRSFEHAAISRHLYVELILRRNGRSYIQDYDERKKAEGQEAARLEKLLRDAEQNPETIPKIKFDSVAFRDTVTLAAPSWSYTWHNDTMSDRKYHDRSIARWRNYPWNKPPAVLRRS